jgi:HAD superfamily hydrolase (TIGR01509 family)
MTLRAIFFDFDGLIADTESAVLASAASIFAEHGATLPLDRWLAIIGTSQPKGFWAPWLSEQTGLDHDAHELWEEAERRNVELVATLSPNPGVEDLLRAARRDGILTRVVSSSPSTWVVPISERLGLRPWLGGYTTREDAVRAKPYPDLYLEALRVTDMRADEVVVFEDSANGARAAVDAGLRVVAVPGPVTAHQDFSHATTVSQSIADLSLAHLHALFEDRRPDR